MNDRSRRLIAIPLGLALFVVGVVLDVDRLARASHDLPAPVGAALALGGLFAGLTVAVMVGWGKNRKRFPVSWNRRAGFALVGWAVALGGVFLWTHPRHHPYAPLGSAAQVASVMYSTVLLGVFLALTPWLWLRARRRPQDIDDAAADGAEDGADAFGSTG